MKRNEVVSILRRASYRLKGRSDAMREARIGRNQYVCAMCGPAVVYANQEINLDHIQPIVGPEGFVSFDLFIERLFCEKEGYQVLCKPHHDEKTRKENEERQLIKNKEEIIINLLDIERPLFVQYLIDRYGIASLKKLIEDKEKDAREDKTE